MSAETESSTFFQHKRKISLSKIIKHNQIQLKLLIPKMYLYYFQSERDITLPKNHRTMTKFQLDLPIPLTYQYVKFELNM
jgi:hypothetical protein